MYEAIKEWLLWLMRVPAEPLDPMGDVESLRVFRAAPGYLNYKILAWAIKQLFGLVVALVILVPIFLQAPRSGKELFLVGGFELIVLLCYPVQAVFSFFLLRLNYEMRWYKITDRSLRIREGVMAVHEMTMTFANIQNVTVEQGPLERLFGIANVKVETAGGGGAAAVPHQRGGESMGLNMHLGVFRGVDNADEIRDLMMERLRKLADTGLGDFDDAHQLNAPPIPAPAYLNAPADAGFGKESIAILQSLRKEAAALRQAAESLTAPAS